MTTSSLWIILGLMALVGGGELLVRGASALAAAARVSPLAIGLTVVAFGTSAPELAVSVQASFAGKTDVAVGNVVGSNIFNVLFILGVSAVITPLVVSSQLIRRDVPLMIVCSIAFLVTCQNGQISRFDGALMFGTLLVYTAWSLVQSRKENPVNEVVRADPNSPPTFMHSNFTRDLITIVVGLVLLGFGANWLVDGAVDLARHWGASELVIGLTIVAVGTSLPEVVTSVVAALRGQRDIAVGNVIGSNIFNILGVLGCTAIVGRGGIAVAESAIHFDVPVMTAVAIACLPIFFTGHLIARWEGALFLAYYIAYDSYIVLAAIRSDFARTFSTMMLFVIPLTVATVGVSLARSLRNDKKSIQVDQQPRTLG